MSNFVYKEKGHSYELDGKKMTGVTTILGVLGKPMLIPWAARMTAEWIRENCGKWAGLDGEDESYDVTENDLIEAVKAHTKKKEAGGEKGKDLHSEVEEYIKKCLSDTDGKPFLANPGYSKGAEAFIGWATTNNIKFLSSETPIYSKELFVAGTPDFTFEKDGKRFVGDLKTHKKIWDRIPHFQTAAYAKMLQEQGENFAGTCIVNINKETNELTEQWSYALAEDIEGFEAALKLYRLLNNY